MDELVEKEKERILKFEKAEKENIKQTNINFKNLKQL
jgi:hypothetical protein